MGEMNTMPCIDCGKRHPATHAEAIGAAWQPARRCPDRNFDQKVEIVWSRPPWGCSSAGRHGVLSSL